MPALPSQHSPETGRKICSIITIGSDQATDDTGYQITSGFLYTWHTPPSFYLGMWLLQWYSTCWCHKATRNCASATRRHSLDRNFYTLHQPTSITDRPGAAMNQIRSFSGKLRKIHTYCNYTDSLTHTQANSHPCSFEKKRKEKKRTRIRVDIQ